MLLHHLGLPDERVVEVAWADLDRTLEPDHLTALWMPRLAAPVAAELVRLEELVRTLRARCPWDQRQTHGSLARHLLEESYEALDAIEVVAATEPDVAPGDVAHLEEELGDLMFQVYFHALLATEEGHFTLADVARTLHDKLVRRHPHVFGDAVAETPEDVAARWEVLKKAENGRTSVTDGIPAALPSLALAAKLQRKAESLGIETGSLDDRRRQIAAGLDALEGPVPGAGDRPRALPESSGETLEAPAEIVAVLGEMLFAVADAARRLGVDPETALRGYAGEFRRRIEATEASEASEVSGGRPPLSDTPGRRPVEPRARARGSDPPPGCPQPASPENGREPARRERAWRGRLRLRPGAHRVTSTTLTTGTTARNDCHREGRGAGGPRLPREPHRRGRGRPGFGRRRPRHRPVGCLDRRPRGHRMARRRGPLRREGCPRRRRARERRDRRGAVGLRPL